MPTQALRLFVSAPIDETVRRRAAALQEELSAAQADFKWVEPESLHLTVAFLGSTPPDKRPEVEAVLTAAAAGAAPFQASFSALGAFGPRSRPRVVWLGLGEGAEPLRRLASAVGEPLFAKGLIAEEEYRREFRAHLTLGRMRGPRGLDRLTKRLQALQGFAPFGCRIDRLALFRSQLSSGGPAYTELSSWPLRQG